MLAEEVGRRRPQETTGVISSGSGTKADVAGMG